MLSKLRWDLSVVTPADYLRLIPLLYPPPPSSSPCNSEGGDSTDKCILPFVVANAQLVSAFSLTDIAFVQAFPSHTRCLAAWLLSTRQSTSGKTLEPSSSSSSSSSSSKRETEEDALGRCHRRMEELIWDYLPKSSSSLSTAENENGGQSNSHGDASSSSSSSSSGGSSPTAAAAAAAGNSPGSSSATTSRSEVIHPAPLSPNNTATAFHTTPCKSSPPSRLVSFKVRASSTPKSSDSHKENNQPESGADAVSCKGPSSSTRRKLDLHQLLQLPSTPMTPEKNPDDSAIGMNSSYCSSSSSTTTTDKSSSSSSKSSSNTSSPESGSGAACCTRSEQNPRTRDDNNSCLIDGIERVLQETHLNDKA